MCGVLFPGFPASVRRHQHRTPHRRKCACPHQCRNHHRNVPPSSRKRTRIQTSARSDDHAISANAGIHRQWSQRMQKRSGPSRTCGNASLKPRDRADASISLPHLRKCIETLHRVRGDHRDLLAHAEMVLRPAPEEEAWTDMMVSASPQPWRWPQGGLIHDTGARPLSACAETGPGTPIVMTATRPGFRAPTRQASHHGRS